MINVPGPIAELGKTTLTKVADKFVDLVIQKYTGKSIKVFAAEGDIEADKIKTKWELLEKPFWLRAEAQKMGRQYTNFGNTLLKSAPMITAGENNISDDNDVFWGLLDHSKEISNEEMQELIAKIIAGEYNKPGSYSMNTLQTIKRLGKDEIELFERMCSLIVNEVQIPEKFFAGSNEVKMIYRDLKIDFGSFQNLQSLGLFLPNGMISQIPNNEKSKFRLTYFDKNIFFELANKDTTSSDIRIEEFYGLSQTGRQLIKHLSPRFNEDYFLWLKKNYQIPGYIIISEL